MLDIRNLAATFDPNEPTGDAFLDARWDAHVAKFGHPLRYHRLFYRLAELLKPRMVLELGAWQGTGAAHWAPWAGTVVTIDHHSDPGDDEHRRLMLEATQQYNNLFYVQGWTWDVRDEVYVFGKYIDVLFIDSWHIYDKAMKDWDTYRDMLRPEGALVICDDLAREDSACIAGMWRFWEDVSAGRERFVDEDVSTFPMGFFRWKA